MFCLLGGIFALIIGTCQCVKGHTYAVAAQHEATTVGRIDRILHGKGGHSWHYVFSVNGVAMDDYSEVCETPLAPRACYNNGPVLVYYSYEPYQNSRLEDFASAGRNAYRSGKIALVIALPVLVLTASGIAILVRKDKRERDADSEDKVRSDGPDDVPDDLHVIPDK